jgi:hypothetical protein
MTGSQTNGPDAERSGGNRADRLLGYGDRLVYILVAALFLLAAIAMALFSAANLVLHTRRSAGLAGRSYACYSSFDKLRMSGYRLRS